MAAFKAWVDELAPAVPPKSALGKALDYTISQWDKLSRFLDPPEVPAHNNQSRRHPSLCRRKTLSSVHNYGRSGSQGRVEPLVFRADDPKSALICLP